MKVLIYQYWSGDIPVYAKLGQRLMLAYANRIGAEYRFDHNPNFFPKKYAQYYSALRPVFDEEFHKYDKVLFVDMDIMPSDELSESIFEQTIEHFGMAQEKHQPVLREQSKISINSKNDKKWAKLLKLLWRIDVPKDKKQRPLVFNSGVVLYSRAGMQFAKKNFLKISLYNWMIRFAFLPKFYRLDQNYLGACAFLPNCEFTELSADWNSQVHYSTNEKGERVLMDLRTSDTRFTHFQLRKRSGMTEEDIMEFLNIRS